MSAIVLSYMLVKVFCFLLALMALLTVVFKSLSATIFYFLLISTNLLAVVFTIKLFYLYFSIFQDSSVTIKICLSI